MPLLNCEPIEIPDDTLVPHIIVYRLPNFMYGLSHSYIDTCLKAIGQNITVRINFITLQCKALVYQSPVLLWLKTVTVINWDMSITSVIVVEDCHCN